MSYAEQIGDKFYEMNPKDAREGDECKLITPDPTYPDNPWNKCRAWNEDDCRKNHPGNIERRRLIAPGEGWRILGVDEVINGDYEFTKDGLVWTQGTAFGFKITNERMDRRNIIAIRQRIPVEAGKNLASSAKADLMTSGSGPVPVENNTGRNIQLDIALDECEHIARRLRWLKEQPSDPRIQAVIDAARTYVSITRSRYPDTAFDNEYNTLESALAALGMEPTKDDEWPGYWLMVGTLWKADNEQDLGSMWADSQWRKATRGRAFIKHADYASAKRLTPAEAQARMEGKAHSTDALLKKIQEFEAAQVKSIRHLNRLATWAQQDPTGPTHANDVRRWVLNELGCAMGGTDERPTWQPSVLQKPPAQDELQVLLERVKAHVIYRTKLGHRDCVVQCLEIQRWIEELLKGRPQKVEGDEFEEYMKRDCNRSELPDNTRHRVYELMRSAAKWHAAKAKGGVGCES